MPTLETLLYGLWTVGNKMLCQSQRPRYMIFALFLNKWLSQNFYWMYLGKIRCAGGGYPPNIVTLKKRIRTSDLQSNKPPPKFIQPHFP